VIRRKKIAEIVCKLPVLPKQTRVIK